MNHRPDSTDRFMPLAAGLITGLAAAAGVLLARRAGAISSVGEGHSARHHALDLASCVMQPKYPLAAMSTWLNVFHFYADDMGRQVEAHHFCIHLRDGLHQCVIFDSNKPNARLIGIEYIISEKRFRQLPEEERRLWHSHHYEVKSGVLIAPGIPELAERAYFKDLVSTYGKTFHTWQIDRDDFPYGAPKLMMGFTQDGQLNEAAVAARDRRLRISHEERKRKRYDIPVPDIAPGANAWESGTSVQTALEEVPFDLRSER